MILLRPRDGDHLGKAGTKMLQATAEGFWENYPAYTQALSPIFLTFLPSDPLG